MKDTRPGRQRVAPPNTKWCNYGAHFVPVTEYGTQVYCKECTKKYNRERKEKYYTGKLALLREKAFEAYGDHCSECGEARKAALTFVPLEEGSGVFKTLKHLEALKFPPGKLSVICYNCKHVNAGT